MKANHTPPLLFRQKCEFKIGATSPEHFPNSQTPEFAFIGRSNVGKSTLLNCIVNRRNLARSSQTPGRTRQLNFFLLNEKLFLVDLPGYGYAKSSKNEVKSWGRLTQQYLSGRSQLQRLFVLIDARRGIKEIDLEMIEFLSSNAVVAQIVLTKADKLNRQEREDVFASVSQQIKNKSILLEQVITCSATTKEGIDAIQQSILASIGWKD